MYYKITTKSWWIVAGWSHCDDRETEIQRFIASEWITVEQFNKKFNLIISEEWN